MKGANGDEAHACGPPIGRRWSRLRADDILIARVVDVDGEVAGTIGSWGDPGEREVTYWIGRSYWGRGIATCALDAFLTVDPSRPLHGRVAFDNVAPRPREVRLSLHRDRTRLR